MPAALRNAFQEVIFDVSINQTIQQSTEWKVNAKTTEQQRLAPKVDQRNRSALRENITVWETQPEKWERKWKNRSTMPSRKRVKCQANGFITTIKNKLQEVHFFNCWLTLNDNTFNICRQQWEVVLKTKATHNGFWGKIHFQTWKDINSMVTERSVNEAYE